MLVEGFAEDTIVGRALTALADAAGTDPNWRVTIDKQIPVAAGLGGGSSDAAAALRLANWTLRRPLTDPALRELAAPLGADVPFFLTTGTQLGEEDGTALSPLDLPQDYWILLLLPHGEQQGIDRGSLRRLHRRKRLRRATRGAAPGARARRPRRTAAERSRVLTARG